MLPYTNDDPIVVPQARGRRRAAVMPLGAPIGSGLGIQNPNNLAIIKERAGVPIIVDAGVGTASDAAIAMELGADGVLMNTAIAGAADPVLMAARDEARGRGRAAGVPGRPHSAADVCLGEQPRRRVDQGRADRPRAHQPAEVIVESERLADRLARLERERADADRQYNERLTGVDQALLKRAELPHPPPAVRRGPISRLNGHWNILPDGEPVIDGSLKGRLRGLIWRLIGPPLAIQKAFNAALVDHVNRNVAAHRESERAIATTIELIRQQTDAQVQFQASLIALLQSLTLYVDTRDRQVGGQAEVINAAISALSDDWLKHWESMLAREARFESRNPALLEAYDELKQKVMLAQQSALLLKRQVEQLISEGLRVTAVPAAPDQPSLAAPDLDAFKYVGFEDRFRGSQDEIRERLTDYLPVFAGASHVLDMGCGRGELLELFRGAGIGARGIDPNQSMVQECRDKGLAAECDDAVNYLQRLPDESLDGVIAIQVVEHLEPCVPASAHRPLVSKIEAARAAGARDIEPGMLGGLL